MSQQLAIMQKGIVDKVSGQIKQFESKGEITFPANYSPENAMKAAWLKLQGTVNKNGASVLESCTQDSIANALMDMVVQGLTPAKDQGYFIAYGRQLVFQRSYFGTMAVTKRVSGAKDIVAQVVYEGDDVTYEIVNGQVKNLVHKQSFGNMKKDKIQGAYATIIFEDREFTEIMSMDEIRQAWKQSKNYSEKNDTTHAKFPGEMAKKTVINRACKKYFKSSDDSSLVAKHFHRQDEVIQEGEAEEEVSEKANTEYIDVEFEEVVEETADPEPDQAEFDEFSQQEDEGPDF